MFKENDLVMYGATGVCRITAIGKPDFALDGDISYYFLEPLYQSGTIYAPCDNEDIAIRPILSANAAKRIMSRISEAKAENFSASSLQQLAQHYQEMIDEHSCDALVNLLKSVYTKEKEAEEKNKKLGQIDRRYLKLAEDLLFGELAAALGKDREQVAATVKKKMS